MPGPPIYVVRRAATCATEDVATVLNTLVADGYEVINIIHHSSMSQPSHDGRVCVIDIIGVRK
jgi:hypothetical protein